MIQDDPATRAAAASSTTCEEVSALVVDALDGTLTGAPAALLERHLAACPACRDELAQLRAVWADLGRLPDEEPSPALAARFRGFLAAYEAGLAARPVRRSLRERAEGVLAALWPRRPAWQLALTAAALVAGLVLGARLGPADDRVAALSAEVATLHRTVSLALLAQDSASARLQGVSYGRDLDDDELRAAFLRLLTEDPSDGVRLAAVDALAPFADREPVAAALRRALGEERSPLVQVALADLLLAADGGAARRAVRELLVRDDLEPAVRRYLAERLGADA